MNRLLLKVALPGEVLGGIVIVTLIFSTPGPFKDPWSYPLLLGMACFFPLISDMRLEQTPKMLKTLPIHPRKIAFLHLLPMALMLTLVTLLNLVLRFEYAPRLIHCWLLTMSLSFITLGAKQQMGKGQFMIALLLTIPGYLIWPDIEILFEWGTITVCSISCFPLCLLIYLETWGRAPLPMLVLERPRIPLNQSTGPLTPIARWPAVNRSIDPPVLIARPSAASADASKTSAKQPGDIETNNEVKTVRKPVAFSDQHIYVNRSQKRSGKGLAKPKRILVSLFGAELRPVRYLLLLPLYLLSLVFCIMDPKTTTLGALFLLIWASLIANMGNSRWRDDPILSTLPIGRKQVVNTWLYVYLLKTLPPLVVSMLFLVPHKMLFSFGFASVTAVCLPILTLIFKEKATGSRAGATLWSIVSFGCLGPLLMIALLSLWSLFGAMPTLFPESEFWGPPQILLAALAPVLLVVTVVAWTKYLTWSWSSWVQRPTNADHNLHQ